MYRLPELTADTRIVETYRIRYLKQPPSQSFPDLSRILRPSGFNETARPELKLDQTASGDHSGQGRAGNKPETHKQEVLKTSIQGKISVKNKIFL